MLLAMVNDVSVQKLTLPGRFTYEHCMQVLLRSFGSVDQAVCTNIRINLTHVLKRTGGRYDFQITEVLPCTFLQWSSR